MRAALDRLNGQVASTTIRTNHYDVFSTSGRPNQTPYHKAVGGYIAGPGGPTEDKIPAYLSNGEYVIRAAAVAKYGVHTFDRMNAMHFAGGGSVGVKKRDHLTQILDALRQALSGFDVTNSLPGDHSPYNPTRAGVAGDMADFRKSIKDAGGDWTKQMRHMSSRMRHESLSIDVHERALTRETAKRDALTETLSTQQQAARLADAVTMTAYSQTWRATSRARRSALADGHDAGPCGPGYCRRRSTRRRRVSRLCVRPDRGQRRGGGGSVEADPADRFHAATVDKMAQPVETTISGSTPCGSS